MGVSVSKHYCGNILKDSSIFTHADGCGDMEMPMDCCHDEIDFYEIQDDFQSSQFSFNLDQQFTEAGFYQSSFIDNLSTVEEVKYSITEPPSPPIILRNIYIQVQSFLL